MTETTETTMRCTAEMNGERCHFLIWHTGPHRSEHMDWPNAPKYCAADAGEGGCVRKAGHAGEHAWRTVTAQALDRGEAWRPSEEGMRAAAGLGRELRPTEDVHIPQPGEEWPPVPCGAPIQGTSGEYTICNMVAGHIGAHRKLPVDPHQDAGEDRPELPQRNARTVTFSDLARMKRELSGETAIMITELERSVNERLVRLEESMGSREEHLSMHRLGQARWESALGEVERRMTALEARFGRLAEDKWRAVAEQPAEEPVPDLAEVIARMNKLEYRVLTLLETVVHKIDELRAEPMEPAWGTVTCGAVGQWSAGPGDGPHPVVCTREPGHGGRCDDRGMTWSAVCGDGNGEPWCMQKDGHDGECDADPSAQVPGPSGRCRAVLLIGESGRYRCTLDQGHDGRHTEN